MDPSKRILPESEQCSRNVKQVKLEDGESSSVSAAHGSVSMTWPFGSPSSSSDALALAPENGFSGTGIYPHPRYAHHMKPHHLEGLNFLCSNLAVEEPGGCVMAQASLSERAFMIICFIQGFLEEYPNEKPLFLLPKAMIGFWKAQFDVLTAGEIPLLDFYSPKAVGRARRLEVLKRWVEEKSVLFLGHRQFSLMVADDGEEDCRDILLNITSVIVVDKGNGLKNDMRSVLDAVALVKTPRKVMLASTIYQKHVKDVFYALSVIRPGFLEANRSTRLFKRKLGLEIEAVVVGREARTPQLDAIEKGLRRVRDPVAWVGVMRELRVLTQGLVYYHPVRFHSDLPELMDFTVFLKPRGIQKRLIEEAESCSYKSFKKSSVMSAVTLHPVLSAFSDRLEDYPSVDRDIDVFLEDADENMGVKTKFFVDLMSFCEVKNEKLLVLSQHTIPLKFLQRLAAKINLWEEGEETFMIVGKTNQTERENSVNRFNASRNARICFGSIKSCSEEVSLVGASRVLMLDFHGNPHLARQAIGLVYRTGQEKKVYAYRIVCECLTELIELRAANKRDINTKIWFEEKEEYAIPHNLPFRFVSPEDSGDLFLQGSTMKKDIKSICLRNISE